MFIDVELIDAVNVGLVAAGLVLAALAILANRGRDPGGQPSVLPMSSVNPSGKELKESRTAMRVDVAEQSSEATVNHHQG